MEQWQIFLIILGLALNRKVKVYKTDILEAKLWNELSDPEKTFRIAGFMSGAMSVAIAWFASGWVSDLIDALLAR